MWTEIKKTVIKELDEICPWCLKNKTILVRHEDSGGEYEEICMECQIKRRKDKKEKMLQNIEKNLFKRGIDKKHTSATLTDFSKSVQKSVESNGSYYIYGTVGTGKTHLAVALFREGLLNYEFESEFIYMTNLLDKIRATFNNNSEVTEFDVTEHYSTLPALYIDDIGVEKPTEWVLMKIGAIIDARYRKELKTIITSNLSIPELSERLGDRTASRFTEMCTIIHLSGKDRRQKKEKPKNEDDNKEDK